jgi:hypothetical protein
MERAATCLLQKGVGGVDGMVGERGCSTCGVVYAGAHDPHLLLDLFLSLNLQGHRIRLETIAGETYGPHVTDVDDGTSHQSARQLGRASRAHGPYLLCFLGPVSFVRPVSKGGSGARRSTLLKRARAPCYRGRNRSFRSARRVGLTGPPPPRYLAASPGLSRISFSCGSLCDGGAAHSGLGSQGILQLSTAAVVAHPVSHGLLVGPPSP